MLVISSYFDKKRDKKAKLNFANNLFLFFSLDLMNTKKNHQNIEYYKIDHFTYKNKIYKLLNYKIAKFTDENNKI